MASPIPTSVCVRALSKSYGSVAAIREVSFEAFPGEIFGLLGPNGAGKTTTLECILGLRTPDSGSIRLDGIDATGGSRSAREVCGAQIQGANLQDKITPRRALELFASFYRRPADVPGLIGRFGLSGKADATFDSLSGGQRQRLFLALAFVNNPRVVVLDEPTTGLDPLARRELHELIDEIRDSGRAVLLSTHDMAEAQALCDRVAILDEGQVVASGSVEDLLTRYGPGAAVVFRVNGALEMAQLAALPKVTACRCEAGLWTLSTTSAMETVAGLVSLVGNAGGELIDLRIVRPTLEDAFISIAGRPWRTRKGEVA